MAIELKVLGCSGGKNPGHLLTSFLIKDHLLLDTGSAASALSPAQQVALDAVLITHCHLDHVGDIPFIADNLCGARRGSLRIISVGKVLADLKRHILNDRIWPDFTVISSGKEPILELVEIAEGEEFEVGGMRAVACPLDHTVPCVGYFLSEDGGTVLITSDTGPTFRIWQKARQFENLRAIITEVSFPNRLREVAECSKHLTPGGLRGELEKMPQGVPVFLYHLKPRYEDEIVDEVKALKDSRLEFLRQGQTYSFGS
ncbi:MAG: MBL fold metallo-hydrolase [Nitrospinota bacterium]